ncbi:MAG: hypothetical protein KC416_12180 [Myxococcales bacterium]|nr:hypothetical protein [Myxococcales bacterium]
MSVRETERTRRTRPSGMTLLEAATLIAVIGTLAAAFLPTFFRSIEVSRVAQASADLSRLADAITAYYRGDLPMAKGRRGCLPDAAEAIAPRDLEAPSNPPPIESTWAGLQFAPAVPQFFDYHYRPSVSGCGVRDAIVSLEATADMDHDGERSSFARTLTIQNGRIEPTAVLRARDRTE